MTIRNLKKHFICNTAESGRTMVELMAVLAIIGVLSVGGFWLFKTSNQERQVDDIIYHMNIQVAQIYPALEQNGQFSSKKDLDTFLLSFKKEVGDYILTFQSDPNASGNDFMMQVTKANGEPIKGGMCRKLISKMSELKMAQDVSFSLKDEEMEDGTIQDVMVPLNERIIDYKSVCGD